MNPDFDFFEDSYYQDFVRELAYGPNPPTADDYTYKADWSQEDREFVAVVEEFPSLSWLASDPKVAIDSLRGVVREALEDMMARLEEIPVGRYAR